MEFEVNSIDATKQLSSCHIIGIFEDGELSPSATAIDSKCNNIISNLISQKDLEGKPGQCLMLHNVPDLSSSRLLIIGLGKKEKLKDKVFIKALSAAAAAINENIEDVACYLTEVEVAEKDIDWNTRQASQILTASTYKFDQLKSDDDKTSKALGKITFPASDTNTETVALAAKQGGAIADAMSYVKDLANLPGNICTPTYLADKAKELAKSSKQLTCKVLNESEMAKLGMGSLLSVSKGSREEAKLITLNYKGGTKNAKPYVFVGKGLTFDAGGISLKPPAQMDEMKYDMCGGASVFGLIHAVAALELPINVIGVIPSSENLPDGQANKPGDIVTSMAGKTIEILNTDAEGRLILCDALSYVEKFKPEIVVDIATLTGACIIALGNVAQAVIGNDQDLIDQLIESGTQACDPAWQLPLWDEYQEQLKSNFADMANIGGKEAGTVTAACFLSRFTEDYNWAHLDIAGTAWKSGKEKGATGRPVPLLVNYLLDKAYGND
ncbi:MAG: leucyl aminopeptidase [Gammaproteobacteria bacterium]|nr:MAG: leucyl aminopeptidase [Gammaproteobacteria bacterium]